MTFFSFGASKKIILQHPIEMNNSENIANLYMTRCLELAALGKENVAPNPMVGAVLVAQDRIIGEGFHEAFGEAHAEVNAIKSVSKEDRHLIQQATLYVSLEPCSHHGKTPPCSDLIIEQQIPNVVIACIDTYSEVAGKGIEKLRKAGISVTLGILSSEALHLNRRFFTFHEKQRPYVILKWAESQDGFMAPEATEQNGIYWISQPETQQLTHQWRAEEAAILVGRNTVNHDNPSLTTRAVTGKNPVRIIICEDPDLIRSDAGILKPGARTIIYNEKLKEERDFVSFEKISFDQDLISSILKDLYQKGIQSIIIEGGRMTLQTFIDDNLWDEARIIQGSSFLKKGIKAPLLMNPSLEQYNFGKDTIKIIYHA